MSTAIASSEASSLDVSFNSSSTQGNNNWLAPDETFCWRFKGAPSFKDNATEHHAVEVSMANIRVN
jgi:hypothetical protein